MKNTHEIPEKVIAKVRKLLNLTVENGATEGEAANSASFIQKILSEYGVGLSEFVVRPDNDETETISEIVDEEVLFETTNVSTWKSVLLYNISKANKCQAFWRQRLSHRSYATNRAIRTNRAFLIGSSYNRFVVFQLYFYLEKQIEELSKEALEEALWDIKRGRKKVYGKLNSKEYTSSWKLGCATRVCQRLIAEAEKMEVTGIETCTAIVVHDIAEKQRFAVEKFIEEKYPDMQKATALKRKKGSGYGDGYSEGENISLSDTKSLV